MSLWNAIANPSLILACKGLCDKYAELPEFFAVTSCVIVSFSNNIGLFIFVIMAYDPDIFLFIMNLQAWAVYLVSNAIAEAIAELPPYPLCNASWNLPNPTLTVISYYYMFLITSNILFDIGPKLYKLILLTISIVLVMVAWGLLGMVDSVSLLLNKCKISINVNNFFFLPHTIERHHHEYYLWFHVRRSICFVCKSSIIGDF